MTTDRAGRRRGASTRLRIIALSAVMLTVAGIELAAVMAGGGGPIGGPWPLWLSLLVLPASFALAEILVVHLRVRSDAHTFSLVELPLALGMFFANPLVMVVANVVGSTAALKLHRKQTPLKLLFNAGLFAVTSASAVLVLRQLQPSGTISPSVLAVGMLALVLQSMLAGLLVFGVIIISSGSVSLSDLRVGTLFGLVTSVFTASLGIIAVVVVDSQPGIAWLLLVPSAGTYLASWAYTTQRRRHEGLDFLYQSARLLHQAPDIESAIAELLRHTCRTFNVSTAELLYLTEHGSTPLWVRVGAGEDIDSGASLDDRQQALLALAQGGEGTRLGQDSVGVGSRFLQMSGYRNAIVAPLQGETRVAGALVIADRLSEVVSFDSTDLRLAETLATHTATALENGRLEQSLEQLRVMEGRLTFQAQHDPLTGLANRTLFATHLQQAIDRHVGRQGAVLFIDLDDFKTVNDSFGHSSGDALLVEVASRLTSCLGDHQVVARLGGDEFAVLLPDARTPETAEIIAQRILAMFDDPVRSGNHLLTIRASIGVAMIQAGDEPGELMRNADTAMYTAKAQGKHRVAFFESQMFESNLSRFNLQLDLQVAITHGQLRPVFQPIVELSSRRVVGVEALVRWDHPSLGELAPDAFLEVAAQSGLLPRVDHAMVIGACAWLAEVDRVEPNLVPWVNVNISPQTLLEAGCLDAILAALRTYRLAPSRLGVEVTEYLMAQDADRALRTLHLLRDAGIRISLDDFGTGYSSLSYLQRLPVSTVKIAKSFVDDVETSSGQRALTEAIVAMAKALDMYIIAEGIEHQQQMVLLASLGCMAGQGFGFSKPLRGDELVGWIRRWRARADCDLEARVVAPVRRLHVVG
jgi:diguanylate cyclase (GGDEF)-like protein